LDDPEPTTGTHTEATRDPGQALGGDATAEAKE
jgi:hypothetical protein